MVEFVDSADELAANLTAFRNDLCADAMTLPDSEVRGIADWAWQCRLKNSIYRGRDSAFSVNRSALDALRPCKNGSDATALYVMLLDQHGHVPGKRFALDFKAMRASGLSRLSIPRLRAARCTIEAVGLLKLASKHKAGAVNQTFVLTDLRPDAANVANLTAPQGQRKAGGEG